MKRHETPTAIADELAKYRPAVCAKILDPATGNGVLLQPFRAICKSQRLEITAIDIDAKPLETLRKNFRTNRSNVQIINADFMKWACSSAAIRNPSFDCIIMNPPFDARKSKSLTDFKKTTGFESLPDNGPIEAAFVLATISLLRPTGRLLAVLPSSIVTSTSLSWLRKFMVLQGSIQRVHELPRFTFRGIESRIYLVVFEKGTQKDRALLLNHELMEPEKFVLRKSAHFHERWDFAFHKSKSQMDGLQAENDLAWRSLSHLATIWRGKVPTPTNSRLVIHTTNYKSPFWTSAKGKASKQGLGPDRVRKNDILVKRVSRNCSQSFGLVMDSTNARASDCIFIIRPKISRKSVSLLFSLRCVMKLEFGPTLIERGTGASYIAQSELADLRVPSKLDTCYRSQFLNYRKAILKRDTNQLERIERSVANELCATTPS
jgi:tRNA1(Val) A37 N6-methylase TrmN6